MFKKKTLSILLASLLATSLLAGCGGDSGGTSAADFPTKPVTIVVPYSAGGGTDLTARAIADAAKEELGESVVVVNKTGAGGAVGMGEAAQADPDGYTIGNVTVELATLPAQKLATFTSDDFKMLMQFNAAPSAVTVRADAEWNTIEEFIEHVKANEGKVQVGNSGVGAIWNLAAIALEREIGSKFVHVPYEGANPAVTALIGGHIDAVTVSPAEVSSFLENGDLKMLAIMNDERMENYPDVPTLKESGVDLSIGTWRGLAVPKETPDDIAKKLEEVFTKATEDENFKTMMANQNATIAVLDSAKFTEKVTAENALFAELVAEIK